MRIVLKSLPFTTKFGNCLFKVMPFGVTGAPATFQRKTNTKEKTSINFSCTQYRTRKAITRHTNVWKRATIGTIWLMILSEW